MTLKENMQEFTFDDFLDEKYGILRGIEDQREESDYNEYIERMQEASSDEAS